MDKRLLSKQQRLTDWVARPVARPNYMLIKENLVKIFMVTNLKTKTKWKKLYQKRMIKSD